MTDLILESSDQVMFVVNKDVAQFSTLLRNAVDKNHEKTILCCNTSGKTLEQIVLWLEHEKMYAGELQGEKTDWQQKFFNENVQLLFDIVLAAEFLGIPVLLQKGIDEIAKCFVGRSPSEIRESFHITNDLSSAEEKLIQMENEWCVALNLNE